MSSTTRPPAAQAVSSAVAATAGSLTSVELQQDEHFMDLRSNEADGGGNKRYRVGAVTQRFLHTHTHTLSG